MVVRIGHLNQIFIKVNGEYNYHDQDRYQNSYRSKSVDRRMSYTGRAYYGQNYRDRSQYDQNYRSDLRKGIFRGIQNYRGQNFRGGYRCNFGNDNFVRSRSRSRQRQYSGSLEEIRKVVWRCRSGSRGSTNRDRIRCFKCREYDHFAKDCVNISDTENKLSEQIQQMLNFEEDKTVLKVLAANTYDDIIKTNSEEAIDNLK